MTSLPAHPHLDAHDLEVVPVSRLRARTVLATLLPAALALVLTGGPAEAAASRCGPAPAGDCLTSVQFGSTTPFEIPLGALIPRRVTNLLAANKNIGTTHITNGCYRLHPVEWNVGEAAGALAAFCLDRGVPPRAVRATPALLTEYQARLDADGVERHWPDVVGY